MPIEIVEAPAVHEALILWIHRVLSPGGDGLANHVVHFGPAVARECEESLTLPGGVAQAAFGERLEERLEQEHDVRLVADLMQAALSSLNFGLKWKPKEEKNSRDFFKSRTGRLTKSFRE
jgi:hypothetical protein